MRQGPCYHEGRSAGLSKLRPFDEVAQNDKKFSLAGAHRLSMRIFFVSSLTELITCRAISLSGIETKQEIVCFFGSKGSIPPKLYNEFIQLSSRLKHQIVIDAVEVSGCVSAFAQPATLGDIVEAIRSLFDGLSITEIFTNSLEKGFIAGAMKLFPDARVAVYDNGLVSHLDMPIYTGEWRIRRRRAGPIAQESMSRVEIAYFSLLEHLPVPAQLAGKEVRGISAEALRLATQEAHDNWADLVPRLPSDYTEILIGTSFYKTERISFEEERNAYLGVVERLSERGRKVAYKEHPRATERPLLTTADNVMVIDSSIPVEVICQDNPFLDAYSISSSSLFTLNKMMGTRMHAIGGNIADDLFPQVVSLFRKTIGPA